MKAKVLMYGKYPRNNQIVPHLIEIERLFDNIFCFVLEKGAYSTENDMLSIIFYTGKNYYKITNCRRQTIFLPENLEKAKKISMDYGSFLNSQMENNQPITSIDLKICEELNIDTPSFIRYREQKAIAREVEKEERKKKEEEELQRANEKERVHLKEIRQKYINGQNINGEDFVALCRDAGIKVHIRTVGVLYSSVTSLNKNRSLTITYQNGKAKPKMDGVNQLIKAYNLSLDK